MKSTLTDTLTPQYCFSLTGRLWMYIPSLQRGPITLRQCVMPYIHVIHIFTGSPGYILF